tara:strand:+ start:288 stop:1628 length:1341 start_codon:yes stop_codon:yes gene_type:complete
LGHVYIVHCIDTEGPLYEGLDANFKRLKNIYGIDLEPSEETLKAIRNGELDLGDVTEAVANTFDVSRTVFNEDWAQIETMLNQITSEKFTRQLVDSEGDGWKYNWFCLDHVGFSGDNPRRRDAGDHKVFDFYQRYTCDDLSLGSIQWHYHPLPITGHFHNGGTTYLNSSNVSEILAKKIIDREWFPSCYRPGFHTERPDSNWFLEQWIPFDYANQSITAGTIDQPDLAGGRYGNWEKATKSWIPYHPDYDDYQKIGNMRRWIARCLNMHARLREISQEDVNDAFLEARTGNDVLLSFTNHDFRNMRPEIEKVMRYIRHASENFDDVSFSFEEAADGFRKCLGIERTTCGLSSDLVKIRDGKWRLDVRARGKLFGPQPFLALKTVDGRYYWENFDFTDASSWSFTFDEEHAPLEMIEKIGVACNSSSGIPEVIVMGLDLDFLGPKST